MLEFGRHYYSHDPATFSSEDTPFVLAYSTIMLNTDAHNPSVKRKMTLLEFIKNNRGINGGQDLPADFLTKVYNSIREQEIKMKDDNRARLALEAMDGIDMIKFLDVNRRLIREVIIHIVPDYLARNQQKHERTMFFFNDLLIVTFFFFSPSRSLLRVSQPPSP